MPRPVVLRRGAKLRVVYAPTRGERRRLDRLVPVLADAERRAAAALGTSAVAHGFVAGRSPVTMAAWHVGLAVTVSADLAGWFDSVRPEQVRAGLLAAGVGPAEADRIVRQVCACGVEPSPRAEEPAPRQGLPTSPAAANLAAVAFDRLVLDRLAALPYRTVYTRYADDLAVSSDDDSPVAAAAIQAVLAAAAAAMGWAIAAHKTRVQRARAGRRVIVGVSVAGDVRPTRATRRRLRAACHQGVGRPQTRGLAEWAACRLPRACRPARQIMGVSAAGAATVAPLAAPTGPSVPAAVVAGTARRVILGGQP